LLGSDVRRIVLDTRDLDIKGVEYYDKEGELKPLAYYISSYNYITDTKNEQLVIELPKGIAPGYGEIIKVKIKYSVNEKATAISWVPKEQTFDKDYEFLYTQCEAIHCRSIAPLQDSPAIKSKFSATIRVKHPYVPIVSGLLEENKTEGDIRIYKFVQEIPVPSYLLALVVGHLEYKNTGKRTGVFAEPSKLNEAANELSEMEDFLNIVIPILMYR
jgi:leukotriene-A4 hydrolase